MSPFRTTAIAALSSALLAGCAFDPRAYETAPVEVETADGIVTCQLYRRDLVTWDRSIDHPATMTVRAADEVCRAEGYRRQEES